MDVTVCVATYGESSWAGLAFQRAIPSIPDVRLVYAHAKTLHDARNLALAGVETEWVIFLDADDELTPGYVDLMAAVDADVRVPHVSYVLGGRGREPYVPNVSGHRHGCSAECLPFGNYIVIGACARTELLREVGGFRDFEWSEDWDLWLRCHLAGATFANTEAVYRAHVRPDSRNRAASRETRLAAHQAIARANGVPVPE